MVPQPVLAVLMLFPVTDASEKAKDEEDARLKVSACHEVRRLSPCASFCLRAPASSA